MRPTISTMKRLIPACVLAGALALAPAADAGKKNKTHKLTGSVAGDANSKLTMKVKVKKGDPKKVKKFTWENLDGYCDGTFVGEQSGSYSGSTPVLGFGDFKLFTPYDQSTSAEEVVDIFGLVRKKGKRVKDGLIAVYFNFGSITCSAPPLGSRDFTATK